MRWVATALAVLAPAAPSQAGGCYRPVYSYGYSYPTYYSAPAYYQPYYQPVYYERRVEVPVAVAVQSSYDCYTASVRDYYRDSLLSDSIALKVLTGSRLGLYERGRLPGPDEAPSSDKPAGGWGRDRAAPQAAPPTPAQPPPSMPPAAAAARPVRTAVRPALTAYLNSACVSCHGPRKSEKGLRLDDPATLSPEMRDKCFREISAGKMPKDGARATPQQLGEVYKWAEDGGRALEGEKAALLFIRPELPARERPQRPAYAARDYRRQEGLVRGR
jgi:hypothetical protein